MNYLRRNEWTQGLALLFLRKVVQLNEAMARRSCNLRPFETDRSPWRQAELFARGRTQPGPRCTKAHAWASAHQYGLAIDLAVFKDGVWTWPPADDRIWKLRDEALAEVGGLEVLGFERPHVQWAGATAENLRAGTVPGISVKDLTPLIFEYAESWGPHEREVHRLVHPGAPEWLFAGFKPAIEEEAA